MRLSKVAFWASRASVAASADLWKASIYPRALSIALAPLPIASTVTLPVWSMATFRLRVAASPLSMDSAISRPMSPAASMTDWAYFSNAVFSCSTLARPSSLIFSQAFAFLSAIWASSSGVLIPSW